MGRIKTQFIKRITRKLIEEYGSEFKKDFEENKKLVAKLTDVSSKKVRNIIAGYVTRMMEMKDKAE